MTKDERIKQINILKNELWELRENNLNAFENFWPDNDFENIKKLHALLEFTTEKSEKVEKSILDSVRQSNNNFDKALPYICDTLMRHWNEIQVRLSKDFGGIMSSLIENQSINYQKHNDVLIDLDVKINQLCLAELLDEE